MNATNETSRRNLYIPGPLWARVRQAAADESARRGRTVSISEWLREVIEERLKGEKMNTIIINDQPVEVPTDAIAWKYADPTEEARWIYDDEEAREIEREDPSLIVWVQKER